MIYVSVESPYAGRGVTEAEIEASILRHVYYAQQCVADSIHRGEIPFASHLLFTQILDDSDPEDRDHGLSLAHAWLLRCDLVAVYEDLGVSRGMALAIRVAEANRIPVERRRIYEA